MENGWVKIHRKILENPIFQRSAYLHLWITLLLRANHKDTQMVWNGDIIVIKEGQLVTGRKALSEETGIAQTTIEEILKFLETRHQIRQQKTTKYRLITILKWDEYQKSDIESDNKATTKRQQSDTNKNDKNDKNKDTAQGAGNSGAVIFLFKEVNPSYAILFRRKPQHEASVRLLEREGFEKLQKVVGFLKLKRGDKFCPRISTPCQLEEKWANLETYAYSLRKSAINNEPKWKIWT
mgnify:FL=1